MLPRVTRPALKTKWNSLSVGGNVCACSLVRGFSSGYPRDCGGPGTQLVGTDVGLRDMDRGAM